MYSSLSAGIDKVGFPLAARSQKRARSSCLRVRSGFISLLSCSVEFYKFVIYTTISVESSPNYTLRRFCLFFRIWNNFELFLSNTGFILYSI